MFKISLPKKKSNEKKKKKLIKSPAYNPVLDWLRDFFYIYFLSMDRIQDISQPNLRILDSGNNLSRFFTHDKLGKTRYYRVRYLLPSEFYGPFGLRGREGE